MTEFLCDFTLVDESTAIVLPAYLLLCLNCIWLQPPLEHRQHKTANYNILPGPKPSMSFFFILVCYEHVSATIKFCIFCHLCNSDDSRFCPSFPC